MTDDPSLLADFLNEATPLLERLGDDLMRLGDDPSADTLNAVFRGFHTVKGGASFLALDAVVALCHRAEDAFGRVRDGTLTVTEPLIDAALDAARVLDQQVAALYEGVPPPPAPPEVLAAFDQLLGQGADDLISEDEFEALLDQLQGGGAPPPAVAPPAAVAPPVAAQPAARPAALRPPDTQVRVDAERLDRLMALVGELVIVRNRLKAHAGDRVATPDAPEHGRLLGELDRVTVFQNLSIRVDQQ